MPWKIHSKNNLELTKKTNYLLGYIKALIHCSGSKIFFPPLSMRANKIIDNTSLLAKARKKIKVQREENKIRFWKFGLKTCQCSSQWFIQKVIKTTIITQDMATNKEYFTLSCVCFNITFFISAVVLGGWSVSRKHSMKLSFNYCISLLNSTNNPICAD